MKEDEDQAKKLKMEYLINQDNPRQKNNALFRASGTLYNIRVILLTPLENNIKLTLKYMVYTFPKGSTK
jgi:hypothetical protein